ncbi:MAG: DUF4203 domain-containing protein [Anaerolineae bacterium]|nr:DUF4203 domain-containing protein [Anaerolineae bacterium]
MTISFEGLSSLVLLNIIIGLAVMAGGIFAAAFGYSLFRFVLAVIGFMVGFSVASSLTRNLDPTVSLFISLGAGIVLAGLGFALIRIGQYIAGALLGMVVALVVLGLLQVQSGGVLDLAGLAVGLGIGAFAGRFFGDIIILTATSFIGAYGIVLGWFIAFSSNTTGNLSSALIINIVTIVLMLAIALVGGFGQYMLYRRIRVRRV